MTVTATVTHSESGWVLSLDGQSRAYDDREEAVEEARRLLREGGGGAIEIGRGPNAKASRIEVPAQMAPVPPIPATPTPPPAAVAPPTPVVPATPKAPAAPAPATTDVTGEIAALRVSYQEARGKIESFGDPVERDIGLATLRIEASHTLAHLRTTGAGLTEEDLSPLSSYVAALSGGETTEAAVEKIDQTTETVLKDVGQSLIAMKLTGTAAVIAPVLAYVLGFFNEIGVAAASLVFFGGGTALIGFMKTVAGAISVGGQADVAASQWASGLGRETDSAMKAPREIERRLWEARTRIPWHHESVAERARAKANLIVTVTWVLIAICIGAFALGFAAGLLDAFNQTTQELNTTPELLGE